MSEAPYLIADLYTEKVAIEEGTIKVVTPCSYAEKTLEYYSVPRDGHGIIYDKDNKVLIINDKYNLTDAEKKCIIACRTDNPSINSFAAEIVYHAGATQLRVTEFEILADYYRSAIKADMGVGEAHGVEKFLEMSYKNEDVSRLIQEQVFYHGER